MTDAATTPGEFTLRLASQPQERARAVAEELPDGPWAKAFCVAVDFPVRSKSNFRRSRAGRDTAWTDDQVFCEELALAVRPIVPDGWELGDRNAPVAARPHVVAHIAAVTLLDTGNIDKSVQDALQGIVFHNDVSGRNLSAATVRRAKEQRWWVAFAQLPPAATPHELAAAHIALQQLWLDRGAPPFT